MKKFCRVVFDRKKKCSKTGRSAIEIIVSLTHNVRKYIIVKRDVTPAEWAVFEKSKEAANLLSYYQGVVESMFRLHQLLTIENLEYYAAMFRGGSYDEKRLISASKIAKIRNHASVKYQVEVNRDYWQKLISEERITDPLRQRQRIKKEKENIRDFVAGVHNSGKAWITGFYVDPMGHEVRDIRVVNIEGAKEGGDYADDINVAANTLCYADNLSTYKSSSKYEADHFTPYENKQDDSCYFFG